MEVAVGVAELGGEVGAGPGTAAQATTTPLRDDAVSETERNFSLAMHLTPFAGMIAPIFLFTPLVLWLVRKDRSPFNDDHGREVVNFGISYVIFTILLGWTIVVPIALAIVAVVSLIRGAIAASRNEYFRYPLTIRFL
jgi:uncharacterized Tic20 family protein